ncbi:hypothetical protein HMPREF9135_1260 [Segatella baroniae F0067]|uniref:Uncharacterized protein n=1 Tax=Segatella baroniae F0067 TaxID=1115809 RepID=U2NR46_9BACT|nr:hypothetical protein HMPREF9135_1260 [Segatella baroniae F0067]
MNFNDGGKGLHNHQNGKGNVPFLQKVVPKITNGQARRAASWPFKGMIHVAR